MSIDSLLNLDLSQNSYSRTVKIQAILIEREGCLIDTENPLNVCYMKILKNYTKNMKNMSLSYDILIAYKDVVHAELRLCKKRINRNCRTSSFVIDTMRSCVNDAVLSFHKKVYPHVKGGQSAKTDVSNALVQLQQSTIESKEGLVTGMEFVRNLDLLMDRLTFCSEQINHLEAVGI